MIKNNKRILITISIILLCCIVFFAFKSSAEPDIRFISYTIDLSKQELKLYWKDDSNITLKSIARLNEYLEEKNQKLIFAMNAGMYKPDNTAQGLFIQNNKIITSLDTFSDNGNFYLKPNGVFYVTNKKSAFISTTENFKTDSSIQYATQSGPMLVIDGNIHPSFKQNSMNLNIRNGVGILPDNNIVFAMSKKEINFYDFAEYFKNLGCKNALYLDGFVSRTYLPEKNWIQKDGNFGVMIGVTKKK